MKVFVDTSAWYAYFDRKDNNHQEAMTFFKKKPELVTSELILAETLALVQRRINKITGQKIGEFLLNSPLIEMTLLTPELLNQSFALFKKTPSRISFVDCTNKVAAESLGIKQIFCFDRDFIKLGLKVVP